MAIPDFYTFLLENITASAARKVELKNAFAKHISWEEQVEVNGEMIDNPTTFQEAFNQQLWEKVRGTCEAGQIELNKEARSPNDTFEDLIE